MDFDKLTAQEQEFASEHHVLLIRFMQSYKLDDELYGALSLRYLKTVHRYLTEPALRKYKFSTIAWLNLRSQLSHELRKSRWFPLIIPLDDTKLPVLQKDDADCTEIWRELETNLTKRDLDLLFLHTRGDSYREIAAACDLTIRAVACRLYRLRKKIRKL